MIYHLVPTGARGPSGAVLRNTEATERMHATLRAHRDHVPLPPSRPDAGAVWAAMAPDARRALVVAALGQGCAELASRAWGELSARERIFIGAQARAQAAALL